MFSIRLVFSPGSIPTTLAQTVDLQPGDMKATPALLAFLATARGNVKDNADVDALTDAVDSLTPATAAITQDPIAGGPVQCTLTKPASGKLAGRNLHRGELRRALPR